MDVNYHTKTDFPKKDGINCVYRINTGANDYLGINTRQVSGGYVTESDINLNMYFVWANSAQPNAIDTGSVFYHEQGHTFGLGESTVTAAIMYYGCLRINCRERFITNYYGFRYDCALQSNGKISTY